MPSQSRSRSREGSNTQLCLSSSPSSDRRRQREDSSSSSQPHHVMTQPVFIQKFLPYAASNPSSPVVFKTVTTSWQETTLRYSGALLCWSVLFKKYKNKSNDDDAAEQDLSAKEFLHLLGTSFKGIQHVDSLWIVDVLFEVLEYFEVYILPESKRSSPHFEVFASLFESDIAARTGNMVIYFEKVLALFDYNEAVRVLLPGILTKQFDPHDLPACMDGILTKMIVRIEEWETERARYDYSFGEDGYPVSSLRLKQLADFLWSCYVDFPENYVAVDHLLTIVQSISCSERGPMTQFFDRDFSGSLRFVVWSINGHMSENILYFAMTNSTPEIVKRIIPFLVEYGGGKSFLKDLFVLDGEERSKLKQTFLDGITSFELENLDVAIDELIAQFDENIFDDMLHSETVWPFFSRAADDDNVEKVALLIRKLELGEYGTRSLIESQSWFDDCCYDDTYHDVVGKSSIHFAIEGGESRMLEYLLDLAASFDQGYLKEFISSTGHCSEYCHRLPPLYFALQQSNTRVTTVLIDKLRSIGDEFLRDQIDEVFDFGGEKKNKSDYGYCYHDYDRGFSFKTSLFLINALSKFADSSEIKLLLERNWKKYSHFRDSRNFIHHFKKVESASKAKVAEFFVSIIRKVGGLDYFRLFMTALPKPKPEKKKLDEEELEEEEEVEIDEEVDYDDEEYDAIPPEVHQYLEQALKSMEPDHQDDGKVKIQ